MPTNFPCPTFTTCPDPSNPFENLSSEDFDGPTFINLDYGFGRPPPKLGSSWRVNSCLGVCESFVSQVDALLCAARNELDCVVPPGGVPPAFPLPNPNPDPTGIILLPPTDPPQTPDPIFFNSQAIITAYCPDGLPFSSVVAAGQFSSTSQALADQMAATFNLQTIVLTKFCLTEITPLTCLDVPYFSAISVSGAGAGGQDPFSFIIISGLLPAEIILTQTGPRTAILSGTPTIPGEYSFVLRATDNIGNYMDKLYFLSIVGVIDPSVPEFTTNTPYSYQLTAVLNTEPGTWLVTAGTLPTGLTLDAAGLLSGTPTSSDPTTFTVAVTDADGFTCSHEFTISPVVSFPLAVIYLPDDQVPFTGANPRGLVTPDNVTLYTCEFGTITTSTDGLVYSAPISVTGIDYLGYGFPTLAATPLFVTVGGAGVEVKTSLDAVTWTTRLSGVDVFRGVAFGNDCFVTVGDFGASAFSNDGTLWSDTITGFAGNFSGIAFGMGVFVAVGSGGAIWTTIDGIVWNAEISGTGQNLTGVAYDNGLFVAVGNTATILTSPDGVTWTPRTGDPQNIWAVAAGGGYYVTVGRTDDAWSSTDGINWTLFRAGAFGTIDTAGGLWFKEGTFVFQRNASS